MYLVRNLKRSPFWQISYKRNGKETTVSTGLRDRSQAEQYMEQHRIQFNGNESTKSIQLKNFIKQYEDYIELTGSTAYLKRSIKPAFKKLLEYTGNVYMSKLDRFTLEKFLLVTFNHSKHLGYLFFRVLRAAFNKAISWEYMEKNPLAGFKLPKIQKNHPLFITTEELYQIIDSTENSILQDIFFMAFFTGLRLGELTSLTWDDLNFDEKIIRVGSERFVTKGKKIRFVPMSNQVKDIFLKYKPSQVKNHNTDFDNKIFKYSRDYISHQFKYSVRSAGLSDKIKFHTLRASFGSYLLQRNVSMAIISNLMGHSSIITTELFYTSLTTDNLRQAVSLFNDIRDEKGTVKTNG